MNARYATELSENGLVPDTVIRHGIRRMLRQRIQDVGADSNQKSANEQASLVLEMRKADIAEVPHRANEQHYEVPAAFYEAVLGSHLKYSCSYWQDDTLTIDDAEAEALRLTSEHAGIENGMRVLELGCGWGSLTLWMARCFPDSRITAVSNSRSQGEFIRQRALKAGLENIEVVTADMNGFEAQGRFHRVVSVEMFEHMRNWPELFRRIVKWLTPEGEFLMHVFNHRSTPYFFEDRDDRDWMSRHFFTGGMMPSADLPLFFQDDLRLEQRWQWDGRHYEKTANAWLENMDRHRDSLWPVMERTYGRDFARTWWMRWRMFFMACAELFAFEGGQEWFVSHYRFSNRAGA